ncbi:MAG: hypothetical protein AMXMBFR61_26130 [Fimbriimonadales bacterium]
MPTGAGRLFCFDALTGNELWRYATDAYTPDDPMQWANTGTPALVDPVQTGIEGREGPVRLYDIVFGCKSKVYCLIPQAGGGPPQVRWTYTLPDRYRTQACPVVRYDGRMYIPVYADNRPAAPGLLIALNKNGTEAWRLELDAYDGPDDPRMDNVVFTNPAMGADGTIYLTAIAGQETEDAFPKSGTLYAIQDLGSSGQVKWRFRPDFDEEGPGFSLAFSSPCVGDDGRIYFGTWDIVKNEQGQVISQSGTLWAVEEVGGHPEEDWRLSSINGRPLGPVESSPVVTSNHVVHVGSVSSATQYRGAFLKATGANQQVSAVLMFESPGVIGDDECNVDATGCIGINGATYRVFQTGEYGDARAFDPLGNLLWGPQQIHRTDLTSVAMGHDGTIYVGTRGGTHGGGDTLPGYVYALWGFE